MDSEPRVRPADDTDGPGSNGSDTMRWYFDSFWGVPPLSPEKNLALIQEYRRCQQMSALASYPEAWVPAEDTPQTLRTYADEAARIRDQLVFGNIGLVIWFAKKHKPLDNPRIDLTDSIQEGVAALLKAIDHFDISKGTRFGAYAAAAIYNALARNRAENATALRLTQHGLRRLLSPDSVVSGAEWNTPARAAMIFGATSLDEPRRPESGETTGDSVRSAEDGPEEQIEKKERREALVRTLEYLPEDERLVMLFDAEQLWHDDGRGRCTLQELCELLGGVEPRSVDTLRHKARARLRHPSLRTLWESIGLPGYRGWMDAANCATTDPMLFVPSKGGSSAVARAVCQRCSVQDECLADEPPGKPFGVRGGESPQERLRARGRRDDAAEMGDDDPAA